MRFSAIKLSRIINKTFFLLSSASLAAMILFTFLDIVLRNFTGSSIPGSYEYVQRYFMPLLVFPALAYTYRSGVLPSTTLLTDRMSRLQRQGLFIFFRLIDIVLFAMISWFGLLYAMDATSRDAAFLAGGEMVPLYPVLYIVPLGSALLVLDLVIFFRDGLAAAADIQEENLSAGS